MCGQPLWRLRAFTAAVEVADLAAVARDFSRIAVTHQRRVEGSAQLRQAAVGVLCDRAPDSDNTKRLTDNHLTLEYTYPYHLTTPQI